MKKYIYVILFLLLLGCKNKVLLHLGNKYNLDKDHNHYYTVFYDETDDYDYGPSRSFIIWGDILKINYDSTYVIALIKPVYKITESKEGKKINNYKDRKKLIETSLMREYWILNKKVEPKAMKNENGYFYSNVYGPFNENDFNKKRKELGISDTLELLTIDELLNKNR